MSSPLEQQLTQDMVDSLRNLADRIPNKSVQGALRKAAGRLHILQIRLDSARDKALFLNPSLGESYGSQAALEADQTPKAQGI